jgi:hypothetical protein
VSGRCIIINNENRAIDYASLNFITSGGAVIVPFNIDTIGKLKEGHRLKFQVENKYNNIFDGEIIEIEKNKVHVDDIRDLGPMSSRKDVRVNVNFDSCILCKSDDGYLSIDIKVRNVSSGGMCFICHDNLAMDKIYETVVDWIKTPIVVKLKLLRKEHVENNMILYGCSFVDLLKEEEKLLRAGVFYIQTKKFKMDGSNVNDAVC